MRELDQHLLRGSQFDCSTLRLNERVDPKPALIGRRDAIAPAGLAQWAGIQQHKLPHRLVTSLEYRPMRTKLIDGSHPFLIWRIIGVIGDFGDFVQSVSR